jgi:hypothetical protein
MATIALVLPASRVAIARLTFLNVIHFLVITVAFVKMKLMATFVNANLDLLEVFALVILMNVHPIHVRI